LQLRHKLEEGFRYFKLRGRDRYDFQVKLSIQSIFEVSNNMYTFKTATQVPALNSPEFAFLTQDALWTPIVQVIPNY
jgi:hypothetical protein